MPSKKQLFTVQVILVLLLFTSCATSKYTYYYSVLKQNDNKVENNFEKTRDRYSEYSIHNLLSDTVTDNNSVLYFLEISEKKIAISVKNRIPIYMDCEKSFISINRSKYKLLNCFSAWINEADRFDKIKNIITFNSNDSWIKRFCETSPLDSFLNYSNYDNAADFYEIRNYVVGDMEKYGTAMHESKNYSSLRYKAFTIDLPVLKFTEENTPLKIGIDLVYYTDAECRDRHEVKSEFYQTELMILKNVRLEVGRRRKNTFYKGEIVGLEVKDISFYTETKTGSVFGGPEILLGLGKTTYWILYPIILPIEIVSGIANAGDGHGVFPYPLFE